ncbi:MAG: response regulator [Myxococcaceae bacterium]
MATARPPVAGEGAGQAGAGGPAPARGRSLEILVVDDEAFARAPLVLCLRAAGHRVTEAADGAAAAYLSSLRTYDVVVSDVRLPRLDGLTLLRKLRCESPATAVILMTAFALSPTRWRRCARGPTTT